MFNKWIAHCSPQRIKRLIQRIDVNLGSPDRNSILLKCHFLRLSDKARHGRAGGEGFILTYFLDSPSPWSSLMDASQLPVDVRAHQARSRLKLTLQIGGFLQLARRLEFSTALTEEFVSILLPISLSPCFKRKSHPLQTSGPPPPALPIFPLRWPGLCSGKGQAAWKGVKVEESAF